MDMIGDSLGPGYDYWKSIKSPGDMGMSGGPSIKTLANNVGGLISYVEVLVTGDSNASKTGDPLGNKFFLKSIATCRNLMADRNLADTEANPIIVPRHIYVDNVPDGTIPFITQNADGTKLDGASGLIPGALGNLTAFSPSGFGRAFSMGNHPDCMSITLKTIDNDNNHGQETHYVAVADILNEIKNANVVGGNKKVAGIDPCRFTDYTNPSDGKVKTKGECQKPDTFSSMMDGDSKSSGSSSGPSSGASSVSDSDSDSDSDSANRKRKNPHKCKKLVAQSDKKYDIMSIKNDTMFDDVVVANGRGGNGGGGDTMVATAYQLPDDIASRIYYATIAGLGMYMIYRLMKKYNNMK